MYVDNDPFVLAHAQALLTSDPAGRTAYIHPHLRDPGKILAHPLVRDTLDFSQPIALILVAILHFIPDEDDPVEIVATLMSALASGCNGSVDADDCPFNAVISGDVLVHGDACLPNIIFRSDGTLSGFVDLGEMGVGHIEIDLLAAVKRGSLPVGEVAEGAGLAGRARAQGGEAVTRVVRRSLASSHWKSVAWRQAVTRGWWA